MTDSFLPHAGGSRVYYYNLYARLAGDFGHNVTVLTKKVPGWAEFDQRVWTDRFRIIRASTPLTNWKYHQIPKLFSPIVRTWALLHARKIELLHIGDLLPQGIIGMWAKKLLGLPYLVYAHGEEITQMDHRRYQPIIRDAIYRNADAVIAANEFARNNLIRIGIPESQIHKITPGVDCQRFSPRPPPKGLIDQFGLRGKTVLLSVGRLVPHKGHSVVLRALANLPKNSPRHHYLIVGAGPERDRLQLETHQLNLSNRVTFVGKVPESQLADFYNLCDLFVLANRDLEGDVEGFGMVFLEANASGKAVLGGRTGGTVEAVAVNSTGLLVDPEHLGEVTQALQLFLCNAETRNRFGEAGRRRALSDFSWEAGASRLNQVCLQTLAHTKYVHR